MLRLAEGVDPASIEVTGNTAVDSLVWVMSSNRGLSAFVTGARHNVLVTLHRRESQRGRIASVARALAHLATPNTEVIFLLHKSPAVRRSLLSAARAGGGARFLEPLDYPDFIRTLADADLVLTDSGGVQEEATVLGKRVLVLRQITDRPEAVEAGNAEVVGLDPDEVLACARQELARERRRRVELSTDTPFGDGRAACRIVRRLARDLTPTTTSGPSRLT